MILLQIIVTTDLLKWIPVGNQARKVTKLTYMCTYSWCKTLKGRAMFSFGSVDFGLTDDSDNLNETIT